MLESFSPHADFFHIEFSMFVFKFISSDLNHTVIFIYCYLVKFTTISTTISTAIRSNTRYDQPHKLPDNSKK